MNKDEINKWHQEENLWWDEHSEIMAYQWKLSPQINKIIRSNVEEQYQKTLYKENGKIIDIGCGTGWLALYFAQKGMDAVGIDFSEEQIKQANVSKESLHLSNLEFICSDFLKFDYKEHIGKYDSIFVNAFLHHLPMIELEEVFKIISLISKKGAKIYLYEPIMFEDEKNSKIESFLLKSYNKSISLFINKIPDLFSLWKDNFDTALKKGYNGMSPNESSIEFKDLKRVLELNSLEIVDLKPEHYVSISYSILSHSIKSPYNKFFEFFVPLIYRIDKIIFGYTNWKAIAKKRNFVLCSLNLKRK